jgi:hypothetical protein
MKLVKIISGLICIPLAAIPPHVMYAMSEDGNLWNNTLFSMMLLAAIASFVSFSASRYIFDSSKKRIVVGIIISYGAMLVLLIFFSYLKGDLPETIMWMPIIIIFGVLYMSPLLGLSFLASILIFGNNKKKTEHGH